MVAWTSLWTSRLFYLCKAFINGALALTSLFGVCTDHVSWAAAQLPLSWWAAKFLLVGTADIAWSLARYSKPFPGMKSQNPWGKILCNLWKLPFLTKPEAYMWRELKNRPEGAISGPQLFYRVSSWDAFAPCLTLHLLLLTSVRHSVLSWLLSDMFLA